MQYIYVIKLLLLMAFNDLKIIGKQFGQRLVQRWPNAGTTLVQCWPTVGTRLVHGWYTFGSRIVHLVHS